MVLAGERPEEALDQRTGVWPGTARALGAGVSRDQLLLIGRQKVGAFRLAWRFWSRHPAGRGTTDLRFAAATLLAPRAHLARKGGGRRTASMTRWTPQARAYEVSGVSKYALRPLYRGCSGNEGGIPTGAAKAQ